MYAMKPASGVHDIEKGSIDITMRTDSHKSAALSDLHRLRTYGIPNLAAARHAEGVCNPCSFHFISRTNRVTQPCKQGHLCNYCHSAEHHDQKKSGRERRVRTFRDITTIERL
eukprot:gnl/TRDRNA2_/TRDRNA2_175321_c0_seq7.p1 gnl/TRDRNA2_/TRDRNA2_175321_c0~~gnl/TRDRNA2_/TRDRNA2_175321_c0_seq7.p1  ORF type:complete len:113 (-),score=6.84 gnl/TRDRNA2_/TRDRNA2_175321_c0_seq7:205-543(-)